MSVPDPPRVVAVIPAHDPGARLASLVAEAAAQVSAVVVVDDGSTTGQAVFDELAGRSGVQVVRQANRGVAAALNAGLRAALGDLRADAVLTLDQDSGLPPAYVTRAVGAWRAAAARGVRVACVTASSYSGRRTPTRGSADGFTRAFDPMQSGSLVPAETFAVVGRYDEGLVIDAVDSDFTARCLVAGLVPVVSPGCDLRHGQGERRSARLLGRPLPYNAHSPERVYYMARNGLLLTRRYARSQPGWVARRMAEEAKAHALRIALDPDRLRLAAAALAGVRDGVAGRTGPRRPWSQPRR